MKTAKFTIIALALSAALTSCSSSDQSTSKEAKYASIEAEINKTSGLFDNENEISAKNEKLVVSALEEALQNNDFVYAKKYCALLKSDNYPEFEKHDNAIRAAESTFLKDKLMKSLKTNDFINASKYCDELKIVDYEEADKCRKDIRQTEATYLISQNTDDADHILISTIDTWPSQKTKIGSETESVHMYDVQAKGHNKQLDEYMDLALKYKNDLLAQKLLELYADELIYQSTSKNGNNVNVVSGYSVDSKKEATKKYEAAKRNW